MVKTPRHSKPASETVTIDLDSNDVSKVDEIKDDLPNEDQVIDEPSTDQPIETENVDAIQPDEKTDVKPEKKSSTSALSAGIIGAVIALAGGAGLQWSGILPSMQSGQSELSAALSEKISGIEQNLTTLDGKLSEQTTSDSANLASSLTALTTRIDALETLVQNDNTGALEAIGEISTRLDDITSRIVNLEQTPVVTGDGNFTLPSDVQSEISNLVALSASQSSEISALKDLIASTGQATAIDEATAQTIADLQSRLSAAEITLAEPNDDIPIARSLAAVTIKNAIDRGGNFSAELDAYSQIDSGNPGIATLMPIAQNGVLSRSELLARFDNVVDQIIGSEKPINSETGIMTRLLDSAANMVKVRKVGDVKGETSEAIAARMEQRLIAGDLQSAMAEWQSLSIAAKAASQKFSNQLQARITAEKLANQLLQGQPATAG